MNHNISNSEVLYKSKDTLEYNNILKWINKRIKTNQVKFNVRAKLRLHTISPNSPTPHLI